MPLDFEIQVDGDRLREVMAHSIASVSVVTVPKEGHGATGVTVSSFTSVTLDPARVLVCLHAEGRGCAAVEAGGCYAINILSGSQARLARRFAASGLTDEERFRWLELNYAVTGSPLIAGCAAWLDCRLMQAFHVGTHKILIGAVLAAGFDPLGEAPLIYHQRAMTVLR